MARKNKKKSKKKSGSPAFSKKEKQEYPFLTSRLKRWIASIALFVVALIVLLSFFEEAGRGGRFIFKGLYFLLGKTVFSLPLILWIGGILFLKPQKKRVFAPIFSAILLLVVALSALFQILNRNGEMPGGLFGYLLSWPFLKLFGFWVSIILFGAVSIVSFLIIWEFVPKDKKVRLKKSQKEKEPQEKEAVPAGVSKEVKVEIPEFEIKKIKKLEKSREKRAEEAISPAQIKTKKAAFLADISKEYKVPPLEIFSSATQKPLSIGDVEYSSLVIKKTLANFGIQVEMGEVNIGPTVTQYTLRPAEGVKLSKIVSLSNDLALALAAHPIRIEAPIPGKSLVGIEVPNRVRAEVRLKELIALDKFRNSPSQLIFPLGKDVSGGAVFADLEKMPHLLVAGSTGSGKTIFLQSLIVSLIYKNSPQILKLILVDPKRVEFPIYEVLPHLLAPVIFNAQKTVNVLNWLIGEMEKRFDVLSKVKARDIQSYNNLLGKNGKLKEEYGLLPYIVLIIDELADLMAAKGREIEAGIVRLSQLARAVGIHLVVATQRPSVDVITGLIKANLTSRVAFQVATQVDSRTILDTAGAETLLGSGDMLFVSSEFGKPKRIQGCFVTQKEVKRVIDFIVKENKFEEDEELKEKLAEELEQVSESTVPFSGGEGEEMEDPLYEEAKRVVREYKKASASLLQRRLKIGYARAARLLDMLEEKGVVGPPDGAKPREVYFDEGETEETEQENFI
jgi:S-DNA-T family DNA segregation ATPase FtsK/SpoIIIE